MFTGGLVTGFEANFFCKKTKLQVPTNYSDITLVYF